MLTNYLYFFLFLIGFLWTLKRRLHFEKSPEKESRKFTLLYREHTNLLLIIFFALCTERLLRILGIAF